ncbi:MAG TPA: hypothetical protein DCL41_07925 [Bdellovibrionales bacterium]|nr:hypothetical protein [Pseudobdellovibrionaceae bacterium]HAG91784.1 hypothetical protein [Bdellovibrionales bacterium]
MLQSLSHWNEEESGGDMKKNWGILLLGLGLVLGCESKQKPVDAANWSGQMQNMSQDIKLLIPFLYDKKSYSAKENEEKISRALDDLKSQSHRVPEKMGEKFLGDDPILSFSLNNLQSDLSRAASSFKAGHKEYSRSVMKSSIGHCFRCHSLTTIGSEAQWDLSDFNQLEINSEEKLDLMIAARKYKEAYDFVEKEITRPGIVDQSPMRFEGLLRKHLALSLRLNEKPQVALDNLNRVLENKKLPPYLEKQVKAWRDSLKGWTHFKKKGDLVQLAEARIAKALKLQEFSYDHAGDVEYIWATDLLHESLLKKQDPRKEAKAYYLLGRAYEVLDDLGSYGLHEAYYEACIKRSPKSKIARRCYDRFESSLKMGFSGSAGLTLPKEERKKLDELKEYL